MDESFSAKTFKGEEIMSGPYAILEANPLLVLHQQSHLPQVFFLLQFLVFLLVGQVDQRRRHLGFK